MQIGEPSKTAFAVAWARADHQSDEPRIFTDPLAARIVGPVSTRSSQFERALDPDLVRRRRMFIAGRSRFADDVTAAAVAAGTTQVVLLGAGLDTSAYRNPHTDVHFFEVDHPATQEWKRRQLAETGITIAQTVHFAPVDFERSTLAAGLAEAGFDRTRSAVFVMLGVVVYLSAQSVTDTLSYIAGQGGTAEVVFDYAEPPTHRWQDSERAKRVAAAGEPFQTFRTAEQFRDELTALGFTKIEDHPAVELLGSYTGQRDPGGPGVHMIQGGHLMHAATA
ncbi:class I SAM-dependent methyltransferase [Nocardia alni]|uniref:class I SAM-dependent methyltransferase n=1 Tax=Nocardia alni TaxID=2815723 RepID=UPI0020B326EC|nr:class I SAM-dependent methyltransferase [Nocardia alni]